METKKLFLVLFSFFILISCNQKEEVKSKQIPTNSWVVLPAEVQAWINNRINEANGSSRTHLSTKEREILDEMNKTGTGKINDFDCSKYKGLDRHFCDIEKRNAK